MKSLFGSPGKISGLVLRTFQCLFAAASLAVMASASGFSTATSFWQYCREKTMNGIQWYRMFPCWLLGVPTLQAVSLAHRKPAGDIALSFQGNCEANPYFKNFLIAAMGLQVLWGFGLACLDIHALRLKKDLHNHIFLSLLVVGDWVTAILSLAAACSSAGVMVVFIKDTDICRLQPALSCTTFQISIALAFMAWFLLAVSSYVVFWLLATI